MNHSPPSPDPSAETSSGESEQPCSHRTRSPMLLARDESLLVVVDAQRRLLDVVPNAGPVVDNMQRVLEGAALLDVPRVVSEQYPEKLGPTDERLRPYLPGALPKLAFSCVGCRAFRRQLAQWQRRQVVVMGIETHVCVLQTCFDILSEGAEVFVIVDAVAARKSVDHRTALTRMEAQGVQLVTAEMVLFEWCVEAGTAEFKQISQIVRRPATSPAGVDNETADQREEP